MCRRESAVAWKWGQEFGLGRESASVGKLGSATEQDSAWECRWQQEFELGRERASEWE